MGNKCSTCCRCACCANGKSHGHISSSGSVYTKRFVDVACVCEAVRIWHLSFLFWILSGIRCGHVWDVIARKTNKMWMRVNIFILCEMASPIFLFDSLTLTWRRLETHKYKLLQFTPIHQMALCFHIRCDTFARLAYFHLRLRHSCAD